MRARRVDENHAAIARALRKAGCTVLDLSRVGGGCGDFLVGRRHLNYMLEVKSAKGKANERQQAFKATWKGHYALVRNEAEALLAVGIGCDALG